MRSSTRSNVGEDKQREHFPNRVASTDPCNYVWMIARNSGKQN